MSETAKIKINIRNGEIEFEGSESFVEKQIDNLESLMKTIGSKKMIQKEDQMPGDDADNGDDSGSGADGIPSTFGEWIQMFKSDANDLDKSLITARYVQHESSTNDFKTSEVNKSLKDHGIKLTNPSSSLKRLITKKYLFQTRKDGKLIYMRISVDGQKYLDSIKVNG